MALRELLAEFQIDPSKATAALQTLDAGINRASGALGALASAFIGSAIVAGLKSFVEGQIEAAHETELTAEKLGVSTEALQEFRFAADRVGVSAEGAAKGLQFLNRNVGEALAGNKEAAQTFAKLDIALKGTDGSVREVGDILPEVADAFAKMGSQQERTAYAMQIFGRSGAELLPLLQKGSEGVQELTRRFHELGGGMSKDFIDRSHKAYEALEDTKFGLQAVKRAIVFEVLPSVVSFANKASVLTAHLLRTNRETSLAKEAMTVFGIASAAAAAKSAVGFAKLLGIIPKDASFWKAALGLGEFILVAAAIALVALAFEDLFGFIQGKDSVIGEVIDSLFGIGTSKEVINEVREAFGEFYDEFVAFKPLAQEFGVIFKEIWVAAVPYLKSLAKDYLVGVATTLKTVLEITRFISKEIGAGLEGFGKFATVAGGFASKLGKDDLAAKLLNFGTAVTKTGTDLQTAAVPRRRDTIVDNKISQTNYVEVTVDGGNSPRENGQAVADGVKDGLGSADLDNALATTQWGE